MIVVVSYSLVVLSVTVYCTVFYVRVIKHQLCVTPLTESAMGNVHCTCLLVAIYTVTGKKLPL